MARSALSLECRMPHWSRKPRSVVLMVVAAPIVVLMTLWPWHPVTPKGWLVLALLGVPICVVLGGVEAMTFQNPVANRIASSTVEKKISLFRMLYIAGALALTAGFMVLGYWMWTRWVE
jgi:hypothetical protein